MIALRGKCPKKSNINIFPRHPKYRYDMMFIYVKLLIILIRRVWPTGSPFSNKSVRLVFDPDVWSSWGWDHWGPRGFPGRWPLPPCQRHLRLLHLLTRQRLQPTSSRRSLTCEWPWLPTNWGGRLDEKEDEKRVCYSRRCMICLIYLYILSYRFSWCIPLDSYHQMIWSFFIPPFWNVTYILKNSCPWNLSCFLGWRLHIIHIRSDWKLLKFEWQRIWEVTCLLKKRVLWSVTYKFIHIYWLYPMFLWLKQLCILGVQRWVSSLKMPTCC